MQSDTVPTRKSRRNTAAGTRKPRVSSAPASAPVAAASIPFVPASAPVVADYDRPTPGHYTAQAIDHAFKASLARLTLGISPAGLATSYFNWLGHLALSPGKHMELMEKAARKTARLMLHAGTAGMNAEMPPCIEPLPQDRRFSGEAWRQWPFNMISQSFLMTQQWWHNATTDIDGLSKEDEQAISFLARQILDRYAPTNMLWTNPEALKATVAQGGTNLVRGAQSMSDDWQRAIAGKKPVGADNFQVGRDVGVTPGKVVYRNHLIELIQYEPATKQVFREPVLIVPAWIMKYYILDLSPHNSLVKYLVDQGHTVFMVSWRNPTSDDRDLGMEDYRQLGVLDALDAVSTIIPDSPVHAVGYCLGGTLLSIAAASMARDGDHRLKSITTLATQVDFTEAGELMLFINESEVAYLENMMWDQGVLDGYQMAGAFQMLRTNDMVWSRMVRDYMLGEHQEMNDLMAWNADLTRMPYRMHSEYLRSLFLNNDLASGRFTVGERPINLADIRAPIFAVGTVKDHVAPWRSVHKITFHPATDVTFLLTSGGHNAGIVSEPGHPRRNYQVATKKAGETYIDPDTWMAETPHKDGSWWPEWQTWLAGQSTEGAALPEMGAKGYAPLCDAPGTYVLQQ